MERLLFPITNYQLPTTNYQLPTTNYQFPMPYSQLLTIHHHFATKL
ncbi:MAG: hypothetical protein AAF630_10255 [Cyanobacteria bacterium P01_C01_bin.38]